MPVPQPVTSAYEEVANQIKTIFEDEFAAEGFTMVFDQLHESLGMERVDVGIAPVDDVPSLSNALVQETTVEVRFYDIWRKEISPNTIVNPTRITTFAERFRRALHHNSSLATARTWYFDVRRIAYPNDPTGNKTRFHATIFARGNNANLVETTG